MFETKVSFFMFLFEFNIFFNNNITWANQIWFSSPRWKGSCQWLSPEINALKLPAHGLSFSFGCDQGLNRSESEMDVDYKSFSSP